MTDEERRMFSNRLRERDAEIERLRADNHKLMLWNEQLQADLDAARRALEPKT